MTRTNANANVANAPMPVNNANANIAACHTNVSNVSASQIQSASQMPNVSQYASPPQYTHVHCPPSSPGSVPPVANVPTSSFHPLVAPVVTCTQTQASCPGSITSPVQQTNQSAAPPGVAGNMYSGHVHNFSPFSTAGTTGLTGQGVNPQISPFYSPFGSANGQAGQVSLPGQGVIPQTSANIQPNNASAIALDFH